MSRELTEVECLCELAVNIGIDGILVHIMGVLPYVKNFGLNIIADFSFNILNSSAIKVLEQSGVNRVTTSIESSFNDLFSLVKDSPLPLECNMHGSLPSMLLEHCLSAMAVTKSNTKRSVGCHVYIWDTDLRMRKERSGP